jgi:hypothetical protein
MWLLLTMFLHGILLAGASAVIAYRFGTRCTGTGVVGTARHHALIHHSDHGSQYLSIRYTERLAEANIEASVAVSVILTTMRWLRQLMGYTKQRSLASRPMAQY